MLDSKYNLKTAKRISISPTDRDYYTQMLMYVKARMSKPFVWDKQWDENLKRQGSISFHDALFDTIYHSIPTEPGDIYEEEDLDQERARDEAYRRVDILAILLGFNTAWQLSLYESTLDKKDGFLALIDLAIFKLKGVGLKADEVSERGKSSSRKALHAN